MSTTAKFTGWVQGRAHANPPIEITGHPLRHSVLTSVRVTGHFPALNPPEVAFFFDELPVGDFTIGTPITITIAEAPEPMVALAGIAEGETTKPPAAAVLEAITGIGPTDPADFQTYSPESPAESEPVVTTEAVTTTAAAGPALVAEANTNEVVAAEFPSE